MKFVVLDCKTEEVLDTAVVAAVVVVDETELGSMN